MKKNGPITDRIGKLLKNLCYKHDIPLGSGLKCQNCEKYPKQKLSTFCLLNIRQVMKAAIIENQVHRAQVLGQLNCMFPIHYKTSFNSGKYFARKVF